jgi:hypothetical protein
MYRGLGVPNANVITRNKRKEASTNARTDVHDLKDVTGPPTSTNHSPANTTAGTTKPDTLAQPHWHTNNAADN